MSNLKPTTFLNQPNMLGALLEAQGRKYELVVVTLTDAPVWDSGDIVATVTGEAIAARVEHFGDTLVTLLDNGLLSALASFRVEAERPYDGRKKMAGLVSSSGSRKPKR